MHAWGSAVAPARQSIPSGLQLGECVRPSNALEKRRKAQRKCPGHIALTPLVPPRPHSDAAEDETAKQL